MMWSNKSSSWSICARIEIIMRESVLNNGVQVFAVNVVPDTQFEGHVFIALERAVGPFLLVQTEIERQRY